MNPNYIIILFSKCQTILLLKERVIIECVLLTHYAAIRAYFILVPALSNVLFYMTGNYCTLMG